MYEYAAGIFGALMKMGVYIYGLWATRDVYKWT